MPLTAVAAADVEMVVGSSRDLHGWGFHLDHPARASATAAGAHLWLVAIAARTIGFTGAFAVGGAW